MSYANAKKCFDDNSGRYQTAKADPAGYNLNTGLSQFVREVESDMSDLKTRLRRIEQLLQRLNRQ